MAYSDLANKTTAIRADLVQTLKLDLIGPDNKDELHAREILPDAPDLWYTTGFLVPDATPWEDRQESDADNHDTGVEPEKSAAGDDGGVDSTGGKSSFLPSSIGLSVLVPPQATELVVNAHWGDYVRLGSSNPQDQDFSMELERWAREVGLEPIPSYLFGANGFARIPVDETLALPIPSPDDSPQQYPLGRGRNLSLKIFSRMADGLGLEKGTRSVSVFLVNDREPGTKGSPRYPGIAFQVEMELDCAEGFVARPNLQAFGNGSREWDEQVADIQYRDVHEYVVGHNVASRASLVEGHCTCVSSDWFPQAQVEKMVPVDVPGLDLRMDTMSQLDTPEKIKSALMFLPEYYALWIEAAGSSTQGMTEAMAKTRDELTLRMRFACDRIRKGLDVLCRDGHARLAFCLANQAMAMSARQRLKHIQEPKWRTFQLAFMVMNLAGLADPTDSEREIVDLLFFPTGGGKTEAYLGIAAYTLVYRRLVNPEIMVQATPMPAYAGMSILMRYTLRLLTLDQLGRAAALVIALELMRKAELERGQTRLGSYPIEIGLWVGSGATPNRLGCKGDKAPGKEYTAYSKWLTMQNRDKESPIPLANCPWCGTPFEKNSFRFVDTHNRTNVENPANMVVHCEHIDCATNDWDFLPIVTVDEALYRRLPAFVIATVDKFAALPWTGQVGMLFGRVRRFDACEGFFGYSESSISGIALDKPLLPPDLIIQDELHLISGPLGTIAGVYEIAIEALSCRTIQEDAAAGNLVKPKIIASTATVRRAERQVAALFGRPRVEVFPPPGPDRKDSFFARTVPAEEVPARLYLGIAAPGKSAKTVALQVILALLARGKYIYENAGGKKTIPNPADPYLTLLYYFNSLRELGASRNMIEDQVIMRLGGYKEHKRLFPKAPLFADREMISTHIQELSSRESTSSVAEAKHRLEQAWGGKDGVDVALATNMISVGLDISRLGLMVVNGQPKAAAEYIQSTSRVGRDSDRPGLVITIFNCFKPRDRSHYERFTAWHDSFYRAVEATSVTPFSPRALDRALAAALVGLVRQGDKLMSPGCGAHLVLQRRAELDLWLKPFVERALSHDPTLVEEEKKALAITVQAQLVNLLDSWEKVAKADADTMGTLHYTKSEKAGSTGTALVNEALAQDLEAPRDHRSKFKANRSMRDVQAPVIIQTERQSE